MGLTIREALKLEELKEVKVVAGKKNIDNEIKWVHICDTVSMADELKGGELLLTYAHWVKNDYSKQAYLIKELAAREISALAVEPGCYFESIPTHMIDIADRLGFPLLEIPEGMPFLNLIEILMGKIVSSVSFNRLLDEANEIYGMEFKNNRSKVLFSIDKEQMLVEALKHGNEEKLFKILKNMFIDMLSNGLRKELIETRCLEIAIMLSRVAVERGVSLETALHLNEKLLRKMRETTGLKKKFNLTKDIIKNYLDLIHKKKKIDNLEIVQRVKEFIHENYAKKLTLEEIADHAYFSPSYLSKIFKEITGITIMDYVTQVRLREAKKLLRDTRMSLNKIANSVGYYDASYLSNVFKKEMGITPGQYRKNVRMEN
jgi:YesN/AraC family two-component response regulator